MRLRYIEASEVFQVLQAVCRLDDGGLEWLFENMEAVPAAEDVLEELTTSSSVEEVAASLRARRAELGLL